MRQSASHQHACHRYAAALALDRLAAVRTDQRARMPAAVQEQDGLLAALEAGAEGGVEVGQPVAGLVDLRAVGSEVLIGVGQGLQVFGAGQLAIAGILYVKLERKHDADSF